MANLENRQRNGSGDKIMVRLNKKLENKMGIKPAVCNNNENNIDNSEDIHSSENCSILDVNHDLDSIYKLALVAYHEALGEVSMLEDGHKAKMYTSAVGFLSVANNVKKNKIEAILKLRELELKNEKLQFEKTKSAMATGDITIDHGEGVDENGHAVHFVSRENLISALKNVEE